MKFNFSPFAYAWREKRVCQQEEINLMCCLVASATANCQKPLTRLPLAAKITCLATSILKCF